MSETPSKGDAESGPPYHAPKDRPCPFCNKLFTSSSLGRHLDLWIKEKNAKSEDGVHIVEQIKKMRGTVTRRQQKKSLGSRRYSSTSVATSAATPIASSKRSPTASEHVSLPPSSLARKDSAPAIPGFNVHNFAVTGVINDIESGQARPVPNAAHGPVPQQIRGSQLNMDMAKKIQDAEDTARAAELALREMISSWRAAKLHIDMTSMPFDFDPLSLDFSALTLQCLQPPPTLSSFNPFPTETSWSIQPPGQQQYTALRAYFSDEFRKWRIKCAAATTALQEDIQYPPSESAFKDDPQEAVRRAEKLADDLEKKVSDHIDTAYSRWEALAQDRKQDTWILELARSIGKKQAQIESMQQEQHALRQENSNLRSQIDQLNKLQQPREYKLMVPATLPVDEKFLEYWQEQAVVHGRRSVGMNLDDRRSEIGTVVGSAIDRWKRVVVSHRPSGSGVLGKRTLDQSGLNGEDHAESRSPSRTASHRTSSQNKAQALSNADNRPERSTTRTGMSGRASELSLRSSIQPTSNSDAGDVLAKGQGVGKAVQPNGGAEEPIFTLRASASRAPPTTGSTPVIQGTKVHATLAPDKDADAEQDDDMSDHDGNTDQDDGMSDKDADAEMEDDDALAYSHVNQGAAMPQTGPAVPNNQSSGAALASSAQAQASTPQSGGEAGAVVANVSIRGGNTRA